MPRPLTAVAVINAKPDSARRIEIADGATPGLRLVIQPSGSKSWAFRYEPGGRAVKLTLGPASGPGALTLAEAREQAGHARKRVAMGADPAAERKAQRVAEAARIKAERRKAEAESRREEDRVAAVLARYYAQKVDRMKSGYEVRRLLEKEVSPLWGARLVGEITRKDVVKLVDDIAQRGAGTTANRTLANLKAFFSWCEDKVLVDANPCNGTNPPKKEEARDRVLVASEVRLLALALKRLDWPWRQFFTLALLTGQRREEIAGMRRRELELDAVKPEWVLPKARTKNGEPHAVPLVPAALAVIREAMDAPTRPADADLVLTTTGRTGISGFSRAKAALDAMMLAVAREEAEARGEDVSKVKIEPWRLHDLRRTAASGMARAGVSVAVVEKVLNHVSGTFAGIVKVYQRHDFADEKRQALTLWAERVEQLSSMQDPTSNGGRA